jgi:hypothetical protein
MSKLRNSLLYLNKISPFLEAIFSVTKKINHPFYIYIKNLELRSNIYNSTYKYKTGIVIQGPISHKLNQIKKNLAFYNLNFPELIIVISTWDDELKAVEEIRDIYNCEIILNSKPLNIGPGNINLQITSTLSGLKKLRELGVERAIKLRSDLTHMNPESLNILEDRIELAELITNSTKKRIVTINIDNFALRLFGISDFFQYGDIKDLITLWDIPLDLRIPKSPSYLEERSILETSKLKFAEVYIFTHFLEKNSFKIEWNLKRSIEALLKYTIPIDALELGLYWNKYSYLAQRFTYHPDNWKFEEFDFNMWLYFTLNPNKLNEITKLDYLIESRTE